MESTQRETEDKMGTPYGLKVTGTGSCESCSLKSEDFFCNLSKGAMNALDGVKFTSGYPKGAVLFAEQEAPRGVFILCKGRVKLTINSSEGKTVILRIADPGEVLGLHAVVSGQPYHASAETLEPCEVNFVRREDFLRFLRENPEASLRAAQQLSQNYQIACEQVRSLGLAHSAMGKLAGFLLLWASKGQPTKQGMRVLLTLTHEEIGQMIGLSRETVTRTMGDFRRRQFVASKGATVVIQNKGALEQFAQM
jgi:CRP/FNR family transcriptional regulator, cyclic AMP receptor protein